MDFDPQTQLVVLNSIVLPSHFVLWVLSTESSYGYYRGNPLLIYETHTAV